jgi:hypothetical protein
MLLSDGSRGPSIPSGARAEPAAGKATGRPDDADRPVGLRDGIATSVDHGVTMMVSFSTVVPGTPVAVMVVVTTPAPVDWPLTTNE